MNLEQILAELAKLPQNDVVEAIKTKHRVLYQQIFNEGHGIATAALKPQLETAEAAVTAEKAKVVEAGKEIEKLKQQNPDVAKIHADYGQQLQQKENELKAEREKIVGQRKESVQDRLLNAVKAKLLTEVDADKVEAMLERREIRGRIQVDDNFTGRIVQVGQTIPYAGDEGAQVLAFAEELKKTVPESLLLSSVQKGTAREGGGSSGGGAGGKGKIFDEIRAQVKAETEKPKEGMSGEERLLERFGVRR